MTAISIQQAFALALDHHRAGRLADAERLYRQILAVQPNHADALHFLGVIAHQMGRDDLAIEWIPRAIALDPHNPVSHSNLGEAYRTMGRLDDAAASFRRALQLQPNDAKAHNNLGITLAEQRQLDEAIAAFQRALELEPNHPEVTSNLGNALRLCGRLDEALAAYRRALAAKPDQPWLHSNLIYALHFRPDEDDRAIVEEQERWNQRFGNPFPQHPAIHAHDRHPDRRLRVGYLSPEFRDHVTGRYLRPLFQHHDHREFEIVCYAGVVQPDQLTTQFQQWADHWRSTVGVGDDAVAEMIRRDRIDILVDLTQHLSENRLPVFARKPAPVQVSFAGYPESTGLTAIPFRISDAWLEAGALKIGDGSSEIGRRSGAELPSPNSDLPPAERVYLIDTFWCYDPCGMEVQVNPSPAGNTGKVTFGSLNNFCKINDRVLNLWARVLAQTEESRLILLSSLGNHRQRTMEFFQRAGISSDRIEFVVPCSRQAYLEWYHRLDIALDPFPYGGHTTSLDALWMGVPVVSLTGRRAVSRAGLSILNNLGLPELVASTDDAYVEIATALAHDLPRLAELRRTLRSRMESSVLMDGPRFARQIEDAYRAMWRQ